GLKEQGELPVGWKVTSLVYAGAQRCFGYVRYFGHDVDGEPLFRIWHEEYLDTVAVAGVQPGVPYGLSRPLATTVQRYHRRGMDGYAFRTNRPLGPFFPQYRCCLRLAELSGIPRVWLRRSGQVHADLHSLGGGPAVYSVPCFSRLCARSVRHRFYLVRRLLCHSWRDA